MAVKALCLGCGVILLGGTVVLAAPVPPEDAPPEWFQRREGAIRPILPGGGGSPSGERVLPSARWIPQGPGPAINGQVEGIQPNNEVSGAVQLVLPHPTDPDLLYVGAVNGGVWRTRNAQAARPGWQPLTDRFMSLSMGALVFDSTDPTSRTLVAGIGRFSSFGAQGGALTGILRSTDGGDQWVELGQTDLAGANISGLIAHGNLIVVSSDDRFGRGGIFRSTDGGLSFAQCTLGLPEATSVSHLVADRADSPRLYAAVLGAGVFRSDDGGWLWTNIIGTESILAQAFRRSGNNNAKLAPAAGGRLYAAALGDGQLEAVGYTDAPAEPAPEWVDMDIPRLPAGQLRPVQGASNSTPVVIIAVNHGLNTGDRVLVEGVRGNLGANGTFAIDVLNSNAFFLRFSQGTGPYTGGGQWLKVIGVNPSVKPGAQGSIHFSIEADPVFPNRIYLGGDRQDGPLPNLIGARDFTGTLWRGDTLQPADGGVPSLQWEHLTHAAGVPSLPGGGTASGSAPHADCRDLAFDAAGRLVQADDGGVYVQTSPRDNLGDWFSLNGNLQVTEIHDVAFDSVSSILISGNQDVGVTQQLLPGSPSWGTVLTGDGGDVAVDDVSFAAMGRSVRYVSFQRFLGFQRRTYDENNRLLGTVFPALQVVGDGVPFVAQFVTPLRLHAMQPQRLLIGGGTALYESLDRGETLIELGRVGANTEALAYGHPLNADLIVVGSGVNVWQRLGPGTSLARTSTPFPGGLIRGIALHPENANARFVIDEARAYVSFNAGVSWAEITGEIEQVAGGDLRTTRVVPIAGELWVLVGGAWGVAASPMNDLGNWRELAEGLPRAPVWDLEHSRELLVAGTLGRGAWQLNLGTTPEPGEFAEWFTTNDNDLAFQRFTFTPQNNGNSYSLCRQPAGEFLTDPAGGFTLGLEDDSFAEIALDDAIPFFGQPRSRFFVGSNGYLTFEEGDTDVSESITDHFARARVSMLFDDLNPETGGRVSWKQWPDRVAVTFENVREFGVAQGNSFQVELFLDGVIRLTYLQVTAQDGLAGLSRGAGTPQPQFETDFTAAPPCDEPGDLQQLLDSAPAGATVTVGPGTRFETLTIAKDVVVEGPGPSLAVVDGRAQGPVVRVLPGVRATLRGVSLRNGFLQSGAAGIWNQGELILEDVVLSGHRSVGGPAGAILNEGLMTLTHCDVAGSLVEQQGAGGIRNVGTLRLENSRVRDSRGVDAGGLWNSGELLLERSTVNNNGSSQAGGLLNEGTMSLTDTAVLFNRAEQGRGGGIFNTPLGGLELLGSTVASNQSGLFFEGGGGGIDNAGRARIRNSTLSGNHAPAGEGGAVHNQPGGILMLFNSTVVRNRAALTGGGIDNLGHATIGSSLIAQNLSGNGPDLAGQFRSRGFSLVQDPAGWAWETSAPGDLVGIDPQISDLGGFGGFTPTHRLEPGSPAVDAGTAFGVERDQRGRLRSQDSPGIDNAGDGTDIGAVEKDPADSTFVTHSEFSPPRGDVTGWVGMQFTLGPDPVEVTALGRWLLPGNTREHTLRLVRAGTAEVLASASIDAGLGRADRFEYGLLAQPVVLEAGASYWLVSQEEAGGDFWQANVSVTHRSLARLDGPVVVRDGSAEAFEIPGHAHGPVDFIYTPCPGAPSPRVKFLEADYVAGFPAQIQLEAFDCDGSVHSVRVWDGSLLLAELDRAPYALTWTNQTPGTHLLAAEAVDNAGLVGRASVSVTVLSPVERTLPTHPGRSRRDFTGWAGWRLSVGPDPVRVAALGRLQLEGNNQTHQLRLVRAADGVAVPGGSTQVTLGSAAPGEFVYGALPALLTLAPGESYDLLSEETSGGDDFCDLDTVIIPTPEINISGPVWGFPQGPLTFVAGMQGRGYGPVNLKYWLPPSEEAGCGRAAPMSLVSAVQPGSVRANFSGWAGLRFTVAQDALEVLRLGRWALASNAHSHRIKLVRAIDGSDLSGGAVEWTPSRAGGFIYTDLPEPIVLNAGESYYLVSEETAGGDAFLDLDTVVTLQGAHSVQPVWRIGGNWNLTGAAGRCYGPVNLQYRVPGSSSGEIRLSGSLVQDGFRLVIDGPNVPLVLEGSTDLRTWDVLAHRTEGTGSWVVLDPDPFTHRFYRARCLGTTP